MTTVAIRQKLYEFIRVADDKKVKAMYTMVAEEATEVTEWWQEQKLIKILDAINAEMKTELDKGVSWQEAKKLLLKRAKNQE